MTTQIRRGSSPDGPAPQDWPDTRQPDNAKIDQQIRNLGWDPVTKKSRVYDQEALCVDYSTQEGSEFLAKALVNKDYTVIVRSQLLSFAPGPFSAVSDLYANCTSNTAPIQLQWSQTVSSTMSFEITVNVEATFFEVVKASMSTSFGMSWTNSETFSQTYGMDVPSKHMGWMERAPNYQTITGEIWMIGPSSPVLSETFYGTGQIRGQATDGRPKGTLVAKDRPMSEEDNKKFCPMRQDAEDYPVISSMVLPYVGTLETVRE